MKFSVPQFIDVEDKIFGPLTLKQGIYIVGSLGITVALFLKFGFIAAILFGGPVLLIAFLLAFVKIQGRPFVHILYSASFYLFKNKLYLWKKMPKKQVSEKVEVVQNNSDRLVTRGVSQSRLKQLAWTLDTTDTFDKKKQS